MPPKRLPIPVDLAEEIKDRMEAGGTRWLEQLKIDIAAAQKKATFELEKASVSYERDSGTLTIAPKGLNNAEQAQFVAALIDMFQLGGCEVDVRFK